MGTVATSEAAPSHTPFFIGGMGVSPNDAAQNFILAFCAKFPKERGLYELFIDNPISIAKEHNFETGLPIFKMRMSGSYETKALLPKVLPSCEGIKDAPVQDAGEAKQEEKETLT